MEKETLKNILYFLEKLDGAKIPFLWKITNGSPLTKEDLIVNDDLDLSNFKITSLPEGLKVDGGLNITYTKLTKYTETQLKKMVKPGYIKGIILNEDPDWDETEFAI
jgi:hypothetical protein